ATSQPFSVVLPILPGLQYRILALKSLATTGAWFTSGPVSPGTTDLTLAVPTPGTPVSPSGPVTDATPDFSVTGVSGIDLYTQALPVGGTAWLGSSADGTVSLPNLPAPVVLTPGKYGWSPVNAAASRSGGGPDAMLDGRLVAGGFLYTDAMYEPELFKAGFFKSELIPFTIP
ncbi:MAG TPA: hypothetical protein VEY30_11625, partial [Myxococcaceae bacterium]|nr:hypothetical protein [Myxococcaceae bacterium]